MGMANSPNKIGSAPGRTDCAGLSAFALLISLTPALELLLRAKLLLVQAILAHRQQLGPAPRRHTDTSYGTERILS